MTYNLTFNIDSCSDMVAMTKKGLEKWTRNWKNGGRDHFHKLPGIEEPFPVYDNFRSQCEQKIGHDTRISARIRSVSHIIN